MFWSIVQGSLQWSFWCCECGLVFVCVDEDVDCFWMVVFEVEMYVVVVGFVYCSWYGVECQLLVCGQYDGVVWFVEVVVLEEFVFVYVVVIGVGVGFFDVQFYVFVFFGSVEMNDDDFGVGCWCGVNVDVFFGDCCVVQCFDVECFIGVEVLSLWI